MSPASCHKPEISQNPGFLCDFPRHQVLKRDLYFLDSVHPPLMVQHFTFSVAFFPEIEAVFNSDLIQFGPKAGHSARNMSIIQETILSPITVAEIPMARYEATLRLQK